MYSRVFCLLTFLDFCLSTANESCECFDLTFLLCPAFCRRGVVNKKRRYYGLASGKHQYCPSPVHCKSNKWQRNMLPLKVSISYVSYSKFLTYAEAPAMWSVLITSLEFLFSVLSLLPCFKIGNEFTSGVWLVYFLINMLSTS